MGASHRPLETAVAGVQASPCPGKGPSLTATPQTCCPLPSVPRSPTDKMPAFVRRSFHCPRSAFHTVGMHLQETF